VIVVYTNVLSAVMQQQPERAVVEWLDQQPRNSVWTTTVTILESVSACKYSRPASVGHSSWTVVLGKLEQRVAGFDRAAAEQAASIMADRRVAGRPGDLRDTMIAGIVLSRRATLATRNVEHFSDLPMKIVNPWTL
jgi:toxin FitB